VVVVPQSMAYAKLAELAPEYGLYSSFMGVLIYWLFATSKDITIGPVAVLSTVTGNVVLNAQDRLPGIEPHVVASALAIIAGSIVLFIGLVRMGWIVNLISLASISAFMTGSAINIAAGQVPTMMGMTGFSTRDATYKVIINSLKHLPDTTLDAAMGLSALAMLYLIRFFCNFMAKKQPSQKKTWFFINTLRTAFVILLYTMISWLVNRNHRSKPLFKILQNVPRGFKHAAVPTVTPDIIRSFTSDLPAAVIVLLIEHIAIAKSFGRVNNYTINPSQELVALGVTNVLGPFLGAYPATGSFSRTAIKAKAGVRTPFAGVITALIVLLAIYALTPVFFYIPSASLSAVIIHAVGDLITPPNTVYQFWLVSPIDVIIFFAGVIVTIFTTIEIGIYVTIATSAAVLLWRIFLAQGYFLGRVKVHSVIGDHLIQGNDAKGGSGVNKSVAHDPETSTRNIFLPLTHADGSNPEVNVENPYPGIFIFRFTEGFNYPNAGHYLDTLSEEIFKQTRRTNPDTFPRLGDRPWNNPGPRRGQPAEDHSDRPPLKALILDFSSVNNVDITSVQNLIDVRNQLDNYTAPERVNWHFASINSRWTKRALASAGFGYPAPHNEEGHYGRWKPIFSVADIGGSDSAAADADRRLSKQLTRDLERGRSKSRGDAGVDRIDHSSLSSDADDGLEQAKVEAQRKTKVAVVHGLARPLFHTDLTSALQSAIANVEEQEYGYEHQKYT
jgi:sodium-independent sulfate anion transporter 11